MSTTPLPDQPSWGLIAQSLTSLTDSLSIIAEYVQELRAERTGEKAYEIGSWVLSSTSEGDACVYLYSTHPKLDYRVTTVYVERFSELPFDAMAPGNRVYDGEQAPTREGAAKRGYLRTCAPFTVATRPTGAKTEGGHDVYRFDRVVSAPAAPPKPNGATPPPAEPAPKPTEPLAASIAGPRGANGPQRVPADAAIMTLLHGRERHYLDNNYFGTTQAVTYGLWQRLLNAALGPHGRDLVTARLAKATMQQVENDKWLPSRARMAAMLEWLVDADADGNPVRPYTIRAAGAVDELRIVLAEAVIQFGEEEPYIHAGQETPV